jgi:hypothetical protein
MDLSLPGDSQVMFVLGSGCVRLVGLASELWSVFPTWYKLAYARATLFTCVALEGWHG